MMARVVAVMARAVAVMARAVAVMASTIVPTQVFCAMPESRALRDAYKAVLRAFGHMYSSS